MINYVNHKTNYKIKTISLKTVYTMYLRCSRWINFMGEKKNILTGLKWRNAYLSMVDCR
jgi:hypothetical protein